MELFKWFKFPILKNTDRCDVWCYPLLFVRAVICSAMQNLELCSLQQIYVHKHAHISDPTLKLKLFFFRKK